MENAEHRSSRAGVARRKEQRMSNHAEGVERLCRKGIVAVVRARSGDQLIEVAKALLAGGVECVEITMTTPNALEVIRSCRQAVGGAMIGVGSVLDAETAGRYRGWAQFVVSPIFNPAVLAAAHEADLPAVPGCFTPTEILNATNAGADLVKVFPAEFFGPKFFQAVLAPMPHLKLTPTGGVTLQTAADFIAAGAVTLGVGSALVTKEALAGDLAGLERLAGQFVPRGGRGAGGQGDEGEEGVIHGMAAAKSGLVLSQPRTGRKGIAVGVSPRTGPPHPRAPKGRKECADSAGRSKAPFAPSGLGISTASLPGAYAPGYHLSPLRGWPVPCGGRRIAGAIARFPRASSGPGGP